MTTAMRRARGHGCPTGGPGGRGDRPGLAGAHRARPVPARPGRQTQKGRGGGWGGGGGGVYSGEAPGEAAYLYKTHQRGGGAFAAASVLACLFVCSARSYGCVRVTPGGRVQGCQFCLTIAVASAIFLRLIELRVV